MEYVAMTPMTLCVPPRPGELCAPVRFLLRHASTVMELTSRHRITGVEWDEGERAVALRIEITDPATARPIDVRFDVIEVEAGGDPDAPGGARSKKIGAVSRDGKSFDVLGTYLGVVADEN